MNRLNVGNVVTNGMQIMSVAGTTAAAGVRRSRSDAASALNNMTDEEISDYSKMRADKMRDETRQYNTGGASPTQHLTDEELEAYQKKRAEGMRAFAKGEDEDEDSIDVDSIMSFSKSPQDKELSKNVKENINWIADYKKLVSGEDESIQDIIKKMRGDDNNADD